MSETTRSSNAVKVRFRVFGKVKVDDDVHGLNINASREQVRTNEVPTYAVTEIVEYAITMRLQHFRVRIETRVAELRDLLGQQLDTISGVTKDDRLVNLKLRGGERGDHIEYETDTPWRITYLGNALSAALRRKRNIA